MSEFGEKPEPTRRSKIASFPASIREELCLRMHDGQRGPQLLPWLNSLPEVLVVLDQFFGEEPVTASNLSDWRNGGYQHWLRKRERIEGTKVLAEYCRKVGEAGASELGLPAALAGGALMAVLEDFDPTTLKMLVAEKPGAVLGIMKAVTDLQTSGAKALSAKALSAGVEQRTRALDQREAQIAQGLRALELKEATWQRQTCELFLKWVADEEAKAIAAGSGSKQVKMDLLMKRMFGERPKHLTTKTTAGTADHTESADKAGKSANQFSTPSDGQSQSAGAGGG